MSGDHNREQCLPKEYTEVIARKRFVLFLLLCFFGGAMGAAWAPSSSLRGTEATDKSSVAIINDEKARVMRRKLNWQKI